MKLDKKTLAIIGVVIAVVVAVIIWYVFLRKPSQSASAQAVQITVPASLPPATLPPATTTPTVQYPQLKFSPLSFMSRLAGRTVTVTMSPIQVGDTVWIGFTPTGTNIQVLVPYSLVDAQSMGLNAVAAGTTFVVSVSGLSLASSSTYASYATQQVPLTVGMVRSLFRGNVTLFAQLFKYMRTNVQAALSSLLNQYSANPALYNLLTAIVNNNALVAPLAITYNFAYSLGIIPPQVASYVSNPAATVVDFGYTR